LFEVEHVRKDGTRFQVEVAAQMVNIGSKTYIYTIERDITERKRAEEDIVKAKEDAEDATKLKDKFVSLVSHDLKSPLTSMLGFMKLIEAETVEPLNEGMKLILEKAIESGGRMSTLIDDLLNMSRLKTGHLKVDMKFYDASLIGARMIADYSYMAGTKDVELRNEIPKHSRIYADKTLLTEAIQNLVTNAIKFSEKGDCVTICLADDDRSTICVKDTGLGMKPPLIEKIFQYGDRISSLGTAGETGTGLGLPLAKEIIEIQGGKLTVESEFGKGTLFKVKMAKVQPRILLVDDDSHFRIMQMKSLVRLGVEIIEAENGKEAMEIIDNSMPHLLITDIQMPIMDGLELLSILKNNERTQNLPVIVVSGVHGMEIREDIFSRGAEDFVTKDSGIEDFIPRVRRFIS